MMGQEGVAGAGRGSQDICTTNRNCNACELFISIFMSVTLTYSGSLLPNADVCDGRRHRRSEVGWLMSALPPKADIRQGAGHVRFVPKADSCTAQILRMVQTSMALTCSG